MVELSKCRHGKLHSDHCAACGAEYEHLKNYRAKQKDAALVEQAQRVGRNVTVTASDGCEVTATPDGHVFYNMADWY